MLTAFLKGFRSRKHSTFHYLHRPYQLAYQLGRLVKVVIPRHF